MESITFIRPANGAVFCRRGGASGEGTLKVTNGNDADGVVSLVSADATHRRYVSMYVRAGEVATMSRVPWGDYLIRFVLGEKWDGKMFRVSPTAFEFDGTFRFEKRFTETFVETSVWEVTLHRVPQGNAKTRVVAVQPLEEEP